MINKEMQKALETLGLTAEETKKVLESADTQKITEIIARAKNADEAIAAITKEFPGVDAEALKAQFNETIAKSEEEKLSAPKELTGDALASVAGGSDSGADNLSVSSATTSSSSSSGPHVYFVG